MDDSDREGRDSAEADRVTSWLAESIATCPSCERPVLRTDPRGLDFDERISHLACLDEGAVGPCCFCAQPITRRQKRDEIDGRGAAHKTCADAAKAK